MNAEKLAWSRIRQRCFDSQDVELMLRLVCAGARSFSGRFGEYLRADRDKEWALSPMGITMPVQLRLSDFSEWECTRRVDGVVPCNVPLAREIGWLVRDFLETLEDKGLRLPAAWEEDPRWQDQLSLCWLALLHGRELELSTGMPCRLVAECVCGSSGRQKREISLMGYLPMGGRITIFFSPLAGMECFDPPELAGGYARGLRAQRRGGTVRLVEAD